MRIDNRINLDAAQIKNNEENNLKSMNNLLGMKNEDEALRKACAGFEGMFLEMMMKTMRQSSDSQSEDSTFIKKSNGEKIFTEMLDQQYVDIVTKTGSNGIGEMLYQNMKASQPQGNNFRSGEELAKMQQLRGQSLTDSATMNNLKNY